MESHTGTGLEYLRALEKFGTKPGLERIKVMLDALGNPQESLRVVHVAGTSGKGSTCAVLHSILCEAGLRTGLFSKPHLQDYRERIRVDRSLISPEMLAKSIETVKAAGARLEGSAAGSPTEFESAVAVALWYFREVRVDIAIVETGMGGTWDATNVVLASVCVVTPIGIDHIERLGGTIEAIAREKAGILKRGAVAVIVDEPAQPARAKHELVARAQSLQCPVVMVGSDWTWRAHPTPGDAFGGWVMDIRGPKGYALGGLELPLLGEHQLLNATTALAAAVALSEQGIDVPEAAVRRGFANVRWPGRLEPVQRDPAVLLDGALNPQGASALGLSLRGLLARHSPQAELHLVVAISADKDAHAMLQPLAPLAASLTATEAASSRLGAMPAIRVAEEASTVATHLSIRVEPNARRAVTEAMASAKPEDIVCVCGSLYMVGEVRGLWREAE